MPYLFREFPNSEAGAGALIIVFALLFRRKALLFRFLVLLLCYANKFLCSSDTRALIIPQLKSNLLLHCNMNGEASDEQEENTNEKLRSRSSNKSQQECCAMSYSFRYHSIEITMDFKIPI